MMMTQQLNQTEAATNPAGGDPDSTPPTERRASSSPSPLPSSSSSAEPWPTFKTAATAHLDSSLSRPSRNTAAAATAAMTMSSAEETGLPASSIRNAEPASAAAAAGTTTASATMAAVPTEVSTRQANSHRQMIHLDSMLAPTYNETLNHSLNLAAAGDLSQDQQRHQPEDDRQPRHQDTADSPNKTALLSPKELERLAYYSGYDVMEGVRTAGYLAAFFGFLFLLFLYKSRCKRKKERIKHPSLADLAEVGEMRFLELCMAAGTEIFTQADGSRVALVTTPGVIKTAAGGRGLSNGGSAPLLMPRRGSHLRRSVGPGCSPSRAGVGIGGRRVAAATRYGSLRSAPGSYLFLPAGNGSKCGGDEKDAEDGVAKTPHLPQVGSAAKFLLAPGSNGSSPRVGLRRSSQDLRRCFGNARSSSAEGASSLLMFEVSGNKTGDSRRSKRPCFRFNSLGSSFDGYSSGKSELFDEEDDINDDEDLDSHTSPAKVHQDGVRERVEDFRKPSRFGLRLEVPFSQHQQQVHRLVRHENVGEEDDDDDDNEDGCCWSREEATKRWVDDATLMATTTSNHRGGSLDDEFQRRDDRRHQLQQRIDIKVIQPTPNISPCGSLRTLNLLAVDPQPVVSPDSPSSSPSSSSPSPNRPKADASSLDEAESSSLSNRSLGSDSVFCRESSTQKLQTRSEAFLTPECETKRRRQGKLKRQSASDHQDETVASTTYSVTSDDGLLLLPETHKEPVVDAKHSREDSGRMPVCADIVGSRSPPALQPITTPLLAEDHDASPTAASDELGEKPDCQQRRRNLKLACTNNDKLHCATGISFLGVPSQCAPLSPMRRSPPRLMPLAPRGSDGGSATDDGDLSELLVITINDQENERSTEFSATSSVSPNSLADPITPSTDPSQETALSQDSPMAMMNFGKNLGQRRVHSLEMECATSTSEKSFHLPSFQPNNICILNDSITNHSPDESSALSLINNSVEALANVSDVSPMSVSYAAAGLELDAPRKVVLYRADEELDCSTKL